MRKMDPSSAPAASTNSARSASDTNTPSLVSGSNILMTPCTRAALRSLERSVACPRRSRLHDLARLDARRADVQPAGSAIDDGAHLLDVGVPAALGAAMRVADAHAEVRTLTAHLAYRRHD